MINEELNALLYEKMSAEQNQYREQLLAQSPEEILNHAYEYAMRKDIVEEMSGLELSDEQATALLKSENPLANVFKAFSERDPQYMTVIRDCIEGQAAAIIQHERAELDALRGAPLYKYPASHARENGELEQYRASYQANIACAKAIDKAISSHHDGYSFDGKVAVRDVVGKFGYDRTLFVLAATVQNKEWDGRFSNGNKNWARTVPIFDTKRSPEYSVQSHPVLADAFVAAARHEYLLSLPLTKEDIKAEALNILSQFQNAREPNSPNGTHYAAQVSPDFWARAKDKDRDRLMNMLPFESLALSSLDGHKGIYATIKSDENRFQKLRLRKPSIRGQLAEAKAEQGEKPAGQQRQNDKEAR